MKSLNITQIQRGCVSDGPGMRTTVFLKGCVFQCPWCCNPETISTELQYFFDVSRCGSLREKGSKLCSGCENNGGHRTTDACPFGIKQPVSQSYSDDDLYAELVKDKDLFVETHGGVTFSGGEPLLHSAPLKPVIEKLKDNHISVFVETTLFVPESILQKVISEIDGFIVDLKLQPELRMLDNQHYLQLMEHNISTVMYNGKELQFRFVFVNSVYDRKERIIKQLIEWNIQSIELIKCHYLAKNKYDKLSLPSKDFTPNENKFMSFVNHMTKKGIKTKILSI